MSSNNKQKPKIRLNRQQRCELLRNSIYLTLKVIEPITYQELSERFQVSRDKIRRQVKRLVKENKAYTRKGLWDRSIMYIYRKE